MALDGAAIFQLKVLLDHSMESGPGITYLGSGGVNSSAFASNERKILVDKWFWHQKIMIH